MNFSLIEPDTVLYFIYAGTILFVIICGSYLIYNDLYFKKIYAKKGFTVLQRGAGKKIISAVKDRFSIFNKGIDKNGRQEIKSIVDWEKTIDVNLKGEPAYFLQLSHSDKEAWDGKRRFGRRGSWVSLLFYKMKHNIPYIKIFKNKQSLLTANFKYIMSSPYPENDIPVPNTDYIFCSPKVKHGPESLLNKNFIDSLSKNNLNIEAFGEFVAVYSLKQEHNIKKFVDITIPIAKIFSEITQHQSFLNN